MILSLNEQASLFLFSVSLGFIIGFIYDIFRIIRFIFNHKKIWVQIEDALYWLISVFFVFLFLLKKNYGEVRFYMIVGVFLGMFLYFISISQLILSVSEKILKTIFFLIKTFLSILLYPFICLYNILRVPVKKSSNFFINKNKKLLQLIKIYVRIRITQTKNLFKVVRPKKK